MRTPVDSVPTVGYARRVDVATDRDSASGVVELERGISSMLLVAMRRLGVLVIGLGLLGSLGVAPVLAASIVVNSLADTAADDGLCALREAITAANTDTASGATAGECPAGSGADAITFSVAGTITLASALPAITTNLSISGAGAITVSGNLLVRPFSVDTDAVVTLAGLTISGGTASFGGGVFNTGTLTITNSTISGNHATIGGGIESENGTLTVTDSTISGNNATIGGGIGSENGTLTVTDSTINGNHATGGGGIDNDTGTLTVTNSTISGNTATTGGGIESTGTLTVTNSTISGNTATTGGGMEVFDGTATVTGSTISGNSAISENSASTGGGISNAGSLTIDTSTISGNTASVAGSGIYNGDSATLAVSNSTISGNSGSLGGGISSIGSVTLTNATITGNTATTSGGGISAEGTEFVVNTIIAGNTAPIGADVSSLVETVTTSVIGIPIGKTLADFLVPAGLANNGGPTQTIALALVAGNPAIDTGTAATCAASPVSGFDQRGRTRPAACDIGAYEAQAPTVAAHANVSAAATSAAGAVVTYTAPVGTTEQGGAATVSCLPASGSTFPVGTTTVTCTGTDAVGHTATTTFQVVVSAFVPTATLFIPTTPPTDITATSGTSGPPGLPLVLGLLALLGLVGASLATRGRPRSIRVEGDRRR